MLCTFLCQDVLMLRAVAIAANVAFISYGALSGLAPVLVLHLVLIAVNVRRLAQTIARSRISATQSERPRLFGLIDARPHDIRAGEQDPCLQKILGQMNRPGF
jgi:hypothetical protein